MVQYATTSASSFCVGTHVHSSGGDSSSNRLLSPPHTGPAPLSTTEPHPAPRAAPQLEGRAKEREVPRRSAHRQFSLAQLKLRGGDGARQHRDRLLLCQPGVDQHDLLRGGRIVQHLA